MRNFLDIDPEVFALDINDMGLKIIKLQKRRRGFEITSFQQAHIRQGIIKDGVIQNQQALAAIIRSACQTVRGKRLNTQYVIACLPEEKSFLQLIQMPKMTEKELQSAVLFEAENYIPLPMEKVYLDFQVVDFVKESDTNHMDVLVNAMPKTIVDSYVSCLEQAGLIPFALEVESQATVRSLIPSDAGAPSTIFLDFGATKANLIIFSQNSIRFTASIPISSQQLTHVIAEALHLHARKAESLKVAEGLTLHGAKSVDAAIHPVLMDLVSQIKKYLSFYQSHTFHQSSLHNGKIERLVLCGGGSNLKQFPEFLNQELKIPVEIGNPFVNIVSPRNNPVAIPQDQALSFATAIGLALRHNINNA